MKIVNKFFAFLGVFIFFGEIAMAGDFSDVLKVIEKNRIDISLENGMRVVILNVDNSKSVSMVLGFDAGSIYEDKPGLAYLTSQVLLFKNKKYEMLEIPKYVESVGGSINVSCDHDLSTITVKCLYEDIYEVLSKVYDILTGFEVDDEVLNIVKPNVVSEIRSKDDDPWDYTRKIFIKEIYGNHPYGREPESDEGSIKSITSDDIKRFFNNFYTPDNSVLVIVGRVDKDKLVGFVKEKFSSWKGRKINYYLPSVMENGRKEVRVKRNLKQSTIRVGHISTDIRDPRRVELKILNFILGGGGFGSRLMEKIREKEGLAYGVSSNFYIDRKLKGYFFVGTQTENKNVSRVIDIITNEIKNIIDNGITEKELEDTKNFAKGSLLLSMESFSSIASFLLSEKIFGLERNYFIKDIEKISVIKKEDIEKAARDYLYPDKLIIVVVGGE